MKTLDLNRPILKEDESPYPKKVNKEGKIEEQLTMIEVVRAICGSRPDGTTKDELQKKGRILKLANKAVKKKMGLRLTIDDAKFVIDEGAKVLDPVVFIQLEDVLEGRPTIGDDTDDDEDDSKSGLVPITELTDNKSEE